MSHTFPPDPLKDDRPDAYSLDTPDQIVAPVLLSSPHSGAFYPPDMQKQMCVSLMTVRQTEDAYIDELFEVATRAGAAFIKANYARAYVDLNRSARELDPDMFHDGAPRAVAVKSPRVRAGLGCIPRRAPDGREIYARPLSKAEGLERLETVHDTYHNCISAYLEHLHARFGVAVLIDCHSMPSNALGRQTIPDIVLGDRFGSSCTNRLTRHIERGFRSLGYTVKRNAPYAGGYTTRLYGRPKREQHAIQIEIRRDLYMTESNLKKNRGFATLQSHINYLLPQWIRLAQSFAKPMDLRDAAE